MLNRVVDNTAVATTTTAPIWSALLDNVNGTLTAISLLLGIAFLLWRWWRLARLPVSEDKE